MNEIANQDTLDAKPVLIEETPTKLPATNGTERKRNEGIIYESHLNQESYTIKSGIAVVINNTEFDARLCLSDRSGSDVDASSLFQRFMELGFESDLMNDASKDDLVEKLQEIMKDKKQLSKTDCLIVALLTHGNEDSVYMTDTCVKMKAVMNYFNAENCPELILKPKIFIFQCSRRSDSRRGEDIIVEDTLKSKASIPNDADTVRIPNESDFLEVYSTSIGDRSFHNTESSSPFLRHLIEELHNIKVDDDIYRVLTKVNSKVMTFEPGHTESKDMRQMPYFVSHLTKDLYLKQVN
ncbi:caspase-3-like [Mytilus californianus]|uniref:caspase-3-like n=1 Tax=Mytilus californianus TaxID=6549 RepID=UPI0022472C4D|nr:caspase-3-like [Mytilus californianus]